MIISSSSFAVPEGRNRSSWKRCRYRGETPRHDHDGRVHPLPDRVGRPAALRGRVPQGRRIAGRDALDYELTHCQEEPDRYILRIRWTSVEDHPQGFRRGEHFPAFFSANRPYVSSIEEMQHYLTTDVIGTGKAAGQERP